MFCIKECLLITRAHARCNKQFLSAANQFFGAFFSLRNYMYVSQHLCAVELKIVFLFGRPKSTLSCKSGVGKLFSQRAALIIQELAEGRIDHLSMAEGQYLKPCNSLFTMQELAIT